MHRLHCAVWFCSARLKENVVQAEKTAQGMLESGWLGETRYVSPRSEGERSGGLR